jgi:hypothetical protein
LETAALKVTQDDKRSTKNLPEVWPEWPEKKFLKIGTII